MNKLNLFILNDEIMFGLIVTSKYAFIYFLIDFSVILNLYHYFFWN